jgi:serine/threonine protein kinase
MRERIIEPDATDLSIENDPSAEVAAARLPARKAFTPVTSTIAAEWIKMLARALQYIHDHGVLHGAIYPGEIRLTPDGVPKLGGFGAAQKVDRAKTPRESSASWMRPNYQSPEQVAGDWAALCPASDVYSLGTVLYELLTGQAPFFGMSIQETREAVGKAIPIAPRNINPRIPAFLDWLCQRCLAKNPADRFATPAEVADALDKYLRSLNASDEETANIEPDREHSTATGDFELQVFHKGQLTQARFPLPRRWVAIGRAVESDIVIQDDYCSRNHCAIYWDEKTGQHVLIVIKAKHGVKINGELVRGNQALIPGDCIQVASTRMVFERKD